LKNLENKDYITHYQKDAEFFDYFEENKYDKDFSSRLHSFINSFIKGNNNKILDIGSGGGWTAKIINEKNSLFLMDLSFKNLSEIKRNHKGFYIQGDALRLPFKNNSFNYIIISEVLEHINKPELIIKEAYRVLSDKGEIIITTPYEEKIKYYLCIHCNNITPANAHLHSFSINSFKKMCNELGYKNIDFYKFGSKFLTVTRLSYFLRFLPFWLWRAKDKVLNFILNKPNTLVVIIKK